MMDETAVRRGVEDLLAAYVDCIDDDRLEEWPDFFVEDCHYLITDRDSHREGLRHGVIYAASRAMLADRVTSLRRVLMFEPHRYRHVVGPIRIDRVADGVAEVRANLIAVRIMHNGANTELKKYSAGARSSTNGVRWNSLPMRARGIRGLPGVVPSSCR